MSLGAPSLVAAIFRGASASPARTVCESAILPQVAPADARKAGRHMALDTTRHARCLRQRCPARAVGSAGRPTYQPLQAGRAPHCARVRVRFASGAQRASVLLTDCTVLFSCASA